jgi:F0F1-type ATP synthase membrane subunit b/b'
MPSNRPTLSQLQAKIKRLEQEIIHLRTLLQIILDTAYSAVNKEPQEKERQKEKEAQYRADAREAGQDQERNHLIREWDTMTIIPQDKEEKEC